MQTLQMIREESPEFQVWANDLFLVGVRLAEGCKVLEIMRLDGTADHAWRRFQQIKTDVCGPDWEAVELYPAESRLIDTGNRYYLWCAPSINLGFRGKRNVSEKPLGPTPQQPFEETV